MIRVRRGTIAALAVVTAAAVIGCGGGGGGGGSRSAVIGGGSSGGAVATTGTLTTGGTTGAAVTTGGGGEPVVPPVVDPPVVDPTAGGTTATVDSTTGSTDATTGNTTGGGLDPSTGGISDPTTGSATTGGSTDPTTGSTTSGGTTGSTDPTTGGSTTGGATTTGGTGGDPYPNGFLRPNAVYFFHSGDPSLVSSVLPDGTDRQDGSGLGAEVLAAVPDPDAPGRYVYAALVSGRYGVYRGATFDPAASETLAPPTFGYITTLQATAHGDAIVVADRKLYLLTGGEVRAIASADAAAVSSDGARIAYTGGAPSGLYGYERASGAVRTLGSGGDSLLPSFSKDGAFVLFSSNRDDPDGATYDLYQVPSGGGAVERITNTPDVDELGACYNAARTMVSYVGLSADPDKTGLFVLSNLGAYRVAADADLAFATYWTDSSGRSRPMRRSGRFQRLPTLAKPQRRTKTRRR